ncbi:MAG: hypothetical protein HY680_01325 [Chloroflexi bacterium]|nr:hypothetical protein [Chloroflexota bacterium]
MKTEVRLKLTQRKPFAEGHSFGSTGPYERLVGKVEFALDPGDPANGNIVDLGLAPRNGRGLVEFSGDLDIMKPVDLGKGNRRILYDVNNRGNKTVLRSMCDGAPNPDPMTLADAGNGFLLRRGYTILWHGWQGDLLPGNGLLTANLPEAQENGKRLRGTVRQEFIAERDGVLTMPLSGAPVIRSYLAVDMDTRHSVFTMREREADPRQSLNAGDWAFAKAEKDPRTGQVKVTPSPTDCYVKGGFKPGWIYELVYETEGSRVMGLGMTGIRDLTSLLKYEKADAAGQPNPLAGTVEKAYIAGSSLSARVIRQFVYDGYNADPAGRRVFDAAYVHVSGGGRVFVNTRFAQVGRFPRQHEEHSWPSERYPFAYTPVPDPFTEELDSTFKRPGTDPLVMHTHSGTEYWQRHASLGHTDPRSGDDLPLPEERVRMYVLSGAQHAGATAPLEDITQQAPNTMATSPFLRNALSLMDEWATHSTPPPPSLVPSRASGTLAPAEVVKAHFPKVPGVNLPISPSRLPRYDYGPDFDKKGVDTQHPPRAVPGQEYPVQVPAVDADGNELGGLRSPEIEAPVGTHTGWSLRRKGFAEGEMASLTGSFIPFPRTRAEREAKGDPRPSIEERYPTHAAYVRAIARAVEKLVAQGLLLDEDAERYVAAAMRRNPLDPTVPLAPLVLK